MYIEGLTDSMRYALFKLYVRGILFTNGYFSLLLPAWNHQKVSRNSEAVQTTINRRR
jgi:hypothetical protein